MKNKNLIYYWASDLRSDSGEGILAKKYLIKLKQKNKKYKFLSINNNENENFKSINSKYIKPILGIFRIWFYNFIGYKTCYINYLPLWNIFLFALLPKKTILGPITGTVYNKSQNFYLSIRYNYFIKFLYKFSVLFLFKKWEKIIFSTNMLKFEIPKKYINRCKFNFVLEDFDFKKGKNKKNNKNKKILFYYRQHQTKYNKELLLNIKKLSKKIKIDVFGDKLYGDNFSNFGKISQNKYDRLLKKYDYTFNGLENLYSLHFLNSLKNNLKVFCDINQKKYYSELRSDSVIFLNFSNRDSEKKIYKIVKNN